jgi:15-cis-phytoene synthase
MRELWRNSWELLNSQPQCRKPDRPCVVFLFAFIAVQPQLQEKQIMQLQTHTWENTLLALAHEAHHAAQPEFMLSAAPSLLQQAFTYCESITATYSRSFHLASALLPRNKRQAVRALYAFCRVSDDIVDAYSTDITTDAREAQLAGWRAIALDRHPPTDDLVALAWAYTRQQYNIPLRYAEQLIEGVAQDLSPRRYRTFEELAAYSYGVASTVGLMSMHIIGYTDADAVRYAVKLGVALQLTNILRDVGEDWQAGRLYLPQDELEAFGLYEEDMECLWRTVGEHAEGTWHLAGKTSKRWQEFMRFQIERNRHLYAEARPGIQLLNQDGRFAIAAAAELYRGILCDIEAHDYDVFSRRSHLTTWGKLQRLPAIWWGVRRGYK